MSFSAEVKEELAKQLNPARHCQLAELAAILHFCGQYGQTKDGALTVGFRTENALLQRKCFTLLKKTYNIEEVVNITGEKKENLVNGMGELSETVDTLIIKRNCCKRAYLRGAFLGCGSISDPKKGYHLEFVVEEEALAMQLKEILLQFEIEAKTVVRKKYFVVYVKEGAGIVELLNIMGAHISLMNLENLRIVKEVRNSVNRRVNCETANIQKTVTASARQIEDIVYLRDSYGLHNLPDNLREMAEVRLENPDAPLKELGEYLSPKVGKSGVNHRLRKLSELADKLRA